MLSALAGLAIANHCAIRLIAPKTQARPGDTIPFAIEFKPDPGWHLYWANPGEAGSAPKIEWDLPPGWKTAAIQWPSPSILSADGIVSYGYDKPFTLIGELKGALGSVHKFTALTAKVSWMACQNNCVSEEESIEMPITIGSREEADAGASKEFAIARQAIPTRTITVKATSDEETYTIELGAVYRTLYFFCDQPDVIKPTANQTAAIVGGRNQLRLLRANPGESPVDRLTGILRANGVDYRVSVPVTKP
jgi:DsbC/DsbD-like thiol-disulfide interchange protein